MDGERDSFGINNLKGEGYKWGTVDYVQSPFAFLIGALHALPDESFGFKCSKNTTSSRGALLDAVDYWDIEEDLMAFTSLHEALSFWDNMGRNCYYAFNVDLNADHWSSLFEEWYEIPVNLLYNAGFMWIDGVNWWFYNPQTVPQGDWGFFTVYLVGDFVMRFFYRDETPAR